MHITILGGGPAGLAAGYYAKKSRIPFTIYEAKPVLGGNCVTLKHGEFLFDSGAHRFHDKLEEITRELQELIGEDFKSISVPSKIYDAGRFIDFPLAPYDLVNKIGLRTFSQVAGEIVLSKLQAKKPALNFHDFATRTYGKTLAGAFLLNYSEKLWGRRGARLSLYVAGERLKGLDLRTFFFEAIFPQKPKSEHYEGSFYYPKGGIGSITQKLGEFCGQENIRTRAKITKIRHHRERIQKIEFNEESRAAVDEMISTLALDDLLSIMEPPPPEDILAVAKSLRYRSLILVALFLNKESVNPFATVYFPRLDFPQTRIYEPRNRCPLMAPRGKTSLISEIPCDEDDERWNLSDNLLIQTMASRLTEIGWIKGEEILDATVVRMSHAYPILEFGFEKKIEKLLNYLKRFENLRLSGRNGKFTYEWIHNMMKTGQEIIEDCLRKKPASRNSAMPL